jgi:RNA polymerase sigma-70 factor, ECF subfamily
MVLTKVGRGENAGIASTETDAQLVLKAQKDLEAYGELYERYVRKIYTYIYFRTGHPEEAEDLTSKVFQKAQLHLPRYREQGLPFSSWLYRIAHNMVANWYRDTGRRKLVSLEEAVPFSGGELTSDETEAGEERVRLMRAIRKLSDDKQQLLILKYSEEYSNAEIGEIMGRSEGAIKSLFHRILVALREEFDQDWEELNPAV